jgi:hypothetical protein
MDTFKTFREWLRVKEDATQDLGNGRIDPKTMAQMPAVIDDAGVDVFDASSGNKEASNKIGISALKKGVPLGKAAEVIRPDQVQAKEKADATAMKSSPKMMKKMRKK